MEHSCEAYWTKAEGLARDAICTMGLGAKRLTDAAKRQLEIADLRAGVNVGLRELGELLYATHTGTPTDSELLLEKMREIDESQGPAPGAGGRTRSSICFAPAADSEVQSERRILPGLRRKAVMTGMFRSCGAYLTNSGGTPPKDCR